MPPTTEQASQPTLRDLGPICFRTGPVQPKQGYRRLLCCVDMSWSGRTSIKPGSLEKRSRRVCFLIPESRPGRQRGRNAS